MLPAAAKPTNRPNFIWEAFFMHATNSSLRKLTAMGLLVALSVLLIWQIHFPIFPAAPWMEYDPADIPIFIGTFLFRRRGCC